jgi:hypothetical protein
MWNDPIVEEVRKARREIANECGNDIHKLAKMIRKKEKERKKQGWKFVNLSQKAKKGGKKGVKRKIQQKKSFSTESPLLTDG